MTTLRFLSTLFLIFFCLGCGPRGSDSTAPGRDKPIGDTLTITIVPYEAAEKLTEEYTPMATYLARKLGKPNGRFLAVGDYAGVVAALEAGQVDVAYLSPLPYAIATSRMKVHP